MVAGVSGRHGNRAVLRVEQDTGYVLAHALIQRQNGMEWIALGQISTPRAATCPSVKVHACFFFPKMIPADIDALVSSLLLISELT